MINCRSLSSECERRIFFIRKVYTIWLVEKILHFVIRMRKIELVYTPCHAERSEEWQAFSCAQTIKNKFLI